MLCSPTTMGPAQRWGLQPRASRDRVAGLGRSRNKLPAEETVGPVFFTQGGCIHVLHFCITCLGQEATAPAHACFWQLPSGTHHTFRSNSGLLPGTPVGWEHHPILGLHRHPTPMVLGASPGSSSYSASHGSTSTSTSTSNSNVSLPNASIIPMLYL